MVTPAPPPPVPAAACVPVGAVVAWGWAGSWQYGTVEGRQDGRVFARPLTGTRRQRERRIPLDAAAVTVIAEAGDFLDWLQARHAQSVGS